MKSRRQNIWMLAVMLADVPVAVEAQYTFIDLIPSGFTYSQGTGISGCQQVGYGVTAGDEIHALLWSGTAASVVDLNPSGFGGSLAFDIFGSQQVGSGYLMDTGPHALLWSGTSASAVDLHPSGFDDSEAYGTSGNQQVGKGGTNGVSHALLWSGTAASAVDLHPSGFNFSIAYAISGTQQVGYGATVGNEEHALLWSGTAASAVDLTPSGFSFSYAHGISGGQQVGWGYGVGTGGNDHALLWSGTAASAVDLHPSGFDFSDAYAISGSRQVGYGDTNGVSHALLWSGTAASVVDLHNFLSSDYSHSYAEGIDVNGNIIGEAYNSSTSQFDAILWVAVDGCGNSATCTQWVTVVDGEAPRVACRPAPNPSGKIHVPGKDGASTNSPSGYYQLLAKDNCDPNPDIFVKDTGSSLVAGPFKSGDIVHLKHTGGEPRWSSPSTPPIVAVISLNGNGLVVTADASGNVTTDANGCLVQP